MSHVFNNLLFQNTNTDFIELKNLIRFSCIDIPYNKIRDCRVDFVLHVVQLDF